MLAGWRRTHSHGDAGSRSKRQWAVVAAASADWLRALAPSLSITPHPAAAAGCCCCCCCSHGDKQSCARRRAAVHGSRRQLMLARRSAGCRPLCVARSPPTAAALASRCCHHHSTTVLRPSYKLNRWLDSRMVSVLNSGAEGPGSNCSRDAVG